MTKLFNNLEILLMRSSNFVVLILLTGNLVRSQQLQKAVIVSKGGSGAVAGQVYFGYLSCSENETDAVNLDQIKNEIAVLKKENDELKAKLEEYNTTKQNIVIAEESIEFLC